MTRIFGGRTREEWATLLEGTDSCFAPVLSLSEVACHPHMAARQAIVELDGIAHPGPAPKFSRTPTKLAKSPEGILPYLDVLNSWRNSEPRAPIANPTLQRIL
ncbi:CoA transferase [Cupriavidus basilensis]